MNSMRSHALLWGTQCGPRAMLDPATEPIFRLQFRRKELWHMLHPKLVSTAPFAPPPFLGVDLLLDNLIADSVGKWKRLSSALPCAC